jgi:hypothetical protein
MMAPRLSSIPSLVALVVSLTASKAIAAPLKPLPASGCPLSASSHGQPCAPNGVGQYACFYRQPNFGGQSFCEPIGNRRPQLGDWNDAVRSVWMTPGVSVVVCTGEHLKGPCSTLRESAAHLGGALNAGISSFQVNTR